MGARESNAGDDFHIWWAASRALLLVKPGADLRLITLEGLARVDDAEESYETVDVAEYFGGFDVATAEALVLSQLKYSTRHPDRAWTAARLSEQRRRHRTNGSVAQPRSVIADLAAAYKRLLDDHGIVAAAKATIALVSNQPADPLLVESISAAAEWVQSHHGTARRSALLAALSHEHADVIRVLSNAVGSRLGSGEFCTFLTTIDLSQTGSLDRVALARAVRVGAVELSPSRGSDSALTLFDLVRREALPGGHRGLTANAVLAELGAPELPDLYPAPPRLPHVPDPLPAPGARVVADAALAHVRTRVVVHGPAGSGKTTALQQVADHLPSGSVVVLFDCYGGGEYLNAGEERHTPQRFATQVINELAQQCGIPLLVQSPHIEGDLWRVFGRRLKLAASTLEPGAVLVVAVDAADDAAVAAKERGEGGFLPGLLRVPLPDRVVVVLTARSHRVASFDADADATVELAPFDAATSAMHLRRSRPNASDEDAATFHDRTGGNPRAQFYALTQANANNADLTGLLEGCARTPEPVFNDLIESALRVSGADAGGQRWLATMLALARPVSTLTFAEALNVDATAVAAFAAGLAPGVNVADGRIQFRDQDFETYVRDRVAATDVTAAHGRLADIFLESRTTDPDAAAHVADHLFEAGRFDELLRLVMNEDSPAGIADGFRREQVQGRRLDLAANAAAETGGAATAVRVAVLGCHTASRLNTLSRLVESHLDLVARYSDLELLRAHALRSSGSGWLGPVLMRLAAALSRDPERHTATRAELDNAEAWLRRWMAGRDGETQHWDIEPDDVAAAAEARYRLDGIEAALEELQRWQPDTLVLDASAALAARIADDVSPDVAWRALHACNVSPAEQAPVLAYLGYSAVRPDPAWVEEVVAALLAKTGGEPRTWQTRMLDVAVRHGDRDHAAALARHWAHDLPAGQWMFSDGNAEGTAVLRCHAAAAALTHRDVRVDALIPSSLRPRSTTKGHDNDPRGHDRREWVETVEPIATAAVVAVRASAGDASAGEVIALVERGLVGRIDAAGHRWFSYDRSYRAWATLAAEAAASAGAPRAVLGRLADAAPQLLRGGAPDLWLDLSETLVRRGTSVDIAVDLSADAARRARTDDYPSADRLDLLARAAGIAAQVAPELGKQLFDEAIVAATSINDDAARLLGLHADLARRADVPSARRSLVAGSLVRAAESVALHVTRPAVVPYEEIAGAVARLDGATGLAAASRWDDEDRAPLGLTVAAAGVGAVDGGDVPPWQALPLDHLIDDNERRLTYQLNIAERMAQAGATGTAAARIAAARAADWLRRRVAARHQPALARRLLDWAAARGLDGAIRAVLEPVATLDGSAAGGTAASRQWYSKDRPAEARALLDHAGSRTWVTLADDVAVLDAAHVYGDDLRAFITEVARATRPNQRVEALGTVAALSGRHADIALAVLSNCLGLWRDWPGIQEWARATLPPLLSEHLTDLAWQVQTDELLGQLRAFTDDDAIRHTILRAIPQARPRLTAEVWQSIAVLLGRLCGPADAREALFALLHHRISDDPDAGLGSDPAGPVTALLWSALGHPRRELRWRAAHAVQELLTHPDHARAAPLAEVFVRCLDRDEAGAFRDPTLHFYRMSAAAALLSSLHRVATVRPAVLARHLADLVRHATTRELPHAQIRELARRTAIAVAAPVDPRVDELRRTNQPTCCHTNRHRQHARSDGRASHNRRYDFDPVDTLPYWYAPLAWVFDVPVDTVTALAEKWILDRWGFDRDDWLSDIRELRDQRSWERMSHRHGSIPPEEKLQLYLEYHAMMTAAGGLIDANRPIHVGTWDDEDGDPWRDWLARHLPSPGMWLADLAAPVPAEPELFGYLPSVDDAWETPAGCDYDRVLGLDCGQLPESVLVAASTSLSWPRGCEDRYVRSALVAPTYADDLQRALAAAVNPHDWKLPDEDESTFEVDFGPFQLRGWLDAAHHDGGGLEDHDPYARGLRLTLPLPGHRFRDEVGATYDPARLALLLHDGAVIAQGVQWAEPDSGDHPHTVVSSSGYRVHVDRSTLLRYLNDTGANLILEVQIGRQRSDTDRGHYRAPHVRIYLIDATGGVAVR